MNDMQREAAHAAIDLAIELKNEAELECRDLLRENAELKANNARLREAHQKIVNGGWIACISIAGHALQETPAQSLEAIRAEERTAIEEIARELSNQYEMESTAAVAIEQLVNAIRVRGAK